MPKMNHKKKPPKKKRFASRSNGREKSRWDWDEGITFEEDGEFDNSKY